MENILVAAMKENQAKAALMKPKYSVGDTVRVLSSLTENIHAVGDFLGQKCIVEKAHVMSGIFGDPRIEYHLRLGNKLESFWEYELDMRIKSKNTKK